MSNNIVNKVISEKDMSVIEKIAINYNMSIAEFGRFIAKSDSNKGVRFWVRFSQDELDIVDANANALELPRNKYCVKASKWFYESGEYKKIDIINFKKDNSLREKRVCVYFSDENEYKEIHKLSKDFSIPFTSLLRYCAINYKIKS